MACEALQGTIKGNACPIASSGGGGGGGGGWNPEYTYYVDKAYTGGDSDGTAEKPFLKIQDAIDLAWTEVGAMAFDNQAIVLVAGGGEPTDAYVEDELVFYPFVNVIGYGTQDYVRVTSVLPIRLYSFGYYNVSNLRFESEIDASMTNGAFFGWYVWARFWNCRFDADVKTNGLGADYHWWELNGCYFSGGGVIDVENVTWWLNYSPSYAPLSADATATGSYTFTGKDGKQYKTGVYFYDAFQSGLVQVNNTSGPAGAWVETAGRLFGTLVCDGANNTVELTGDGYPEAGLVLLNGAVPRPSGNAYGLKYTAFLPADWGVGGPPDDVGEALDRLAAAVPL